jgi:hypothetical protein
LRKTQLITGVPPQPDRLSGGHIAIPPRPLCENTSPVIEPRLDMKTLAKKDGLLYHATIDSGAINAGHAAG